MSLHQLPAHRSTAAPLPSAGGGGGLPPGPDCLLFTPRRARAALPGGRGEEAGGEAAEGETVLLRVPQTHLLHIRNLSFNACVSFGSLFLAGCVAGQAPPQPFSLSSFLLKEQEWALDTLGWVLLSLAEHHGVLSLTSSMENDEENATLVGDDCRMQAQEALAKCLKAATGAMAFWANKEGWGRDDGPVQSGDVFPSDGSKELLLMKLFEQFFSYRAMVLVKSNV